MYHSVHGIYQTNVDQKEYKYYWDALPSQVPSLLYQPALHLLFPPQ